MLGLVTTSRTRPKLPGAPLRSLACTRAPSARLFLKRRSCFRWLTARAWDRTRPGVLRGEAQRRRGMTRSPPTRHLVGFWWQDFGSRAVNGGANRSANSPPDQKLLVRRSEQLWWAARSGGQRVSTFLAFRILTEGPRVLCTRGF